MKPNSAFSCVLIMSSIILLSSDPLYGADAVIHAQWDDGGPSEQPQEDIHYRVTTTPPASPDFPDVELIAGRLDWRVWSTDADNPGGIGDIGVISSPDPDNFAIKVLDPNGGSGARDVRGITLVPSTPDNFSNVISAIILGELTEELTVQADATGAGGEADH